MGRFFRRFYSDEEPALGLEKKRVLCKGRPDVGILVETDIRSIAVLPAGHIWRSTRSNKPFQSGHSHRTCLDVYNNYYTHEFRKVSE